MVKNIAQDQNKDTQKTKHYITNKLAREKLKNC